MLDGLRKQGFKLTFGEDNSGLLLLVLDRGGGYYIGHSSHCSEITKFLLTDNALRTDCGASQLIIDGKIKLKGDSLIERFTKSGIKFENGSELLADVVVFATG